MKNILIGTANGEFEIRYSEMQKLVICMGANVVIYNVETLEQAYDVAERNFRNFKRA